MKMKDLTEWGRVVKGVNTTADVDTNSISREANKFGNKVDKDGRPPTLSSKVKGKSTNVLFNLGLTEELKKESLKDFAKFCMNYLELESKPKIKITNKKLDKTFGFFNTETETLTVSASNRHTVDVMRTLAHELVHLKQQERGDVLDGSDGSESENEANSIAGVIMRKWAKRFPEIFNEQWSDSYKRSIDCNNPKGFSQKAHCAGRNKNEAQEIGSTTEIYVDMDGVLADFFGAWKKLIGQGWREITDIDSALQKIRETDNFWLNLPVTKNADNLLGLIKDIKGSYNILSSPLPDDPNSEPHKREWIKEHLAAFPPKEVIITFDKAVYATQQDGTPNILIDDYGVNINKWEAAGGVGFKHKDHKFERTAKNLKQYIQEPVTETNENLVLNKPTPSIAQLVKKHGVSRKHIMDQLKMGIQAELEHTSDKETCIKIALDHIAEDPNYYTHLKFVELDE